MGHTELIKAIGLLDQAMDAVRLLPLIPPLAWLRSTVLDRLTSEEAPPSSGRDRALFIGCQALLPLCGGNDWPLALPGALRRVLTGVCTVGRIVFSDAAGARAGCCLCLRRLRTFQTGEAVLTPLLQYYGPEIAAEEKRAYGEQLSILQTAYARQLLLYRYIAKAEAGRLRERYTEEAEEKLRLLPTPEELHHLVDRRRLAEKEMEEKILDFCHPADNAKNLSLIDMETAEGGEGECSPFRIGT